MHKLSPGLFLLYLEVSTKLSVGSYFTKATLKLFLWKLISRKGSLSEPLSCDYVLIVALCTNYTKNKAKIQILSSLFSTAMIYSYEVTHTNVPLPFYTRVPLFIYLEILACICRILI